MSLTRIFRVTQSVMSFGVDVRILAQNYEKTQAWTMAPPTMEPIEEGAMIPVALHLTTEEAQQLCDELWNAGVRPSNGEGSTGQLAATQHHLADMQKIVFHQLKINREAK